MLTERLSYSAKNYSVLCIDHDEELLTRLREELSKFFSRVLVAKDAKSALSAYRKEPTDIIITNIGSGKSDGLDMAANLKEYNPKVKILLLTRHDDKESLIKALKMGVDYYVKKPLEIGELYEGLFVLLRSLDVWYHQVEDKNIMIYEPDAINSKIYDYITILKNNKTLLKVVNYYKGIEIAHKAMILKVDGEKVYLVVDGVQYAAARYEGKVIICSDMLDKDIVAKVGDKSLNVNDKYIIEAVNLSLLDYTPTRRGDMRLIPDESIKLTFLYDGLVIEGNIVDISQNSVALKIETLPNTVKKGDSVEAHISIKVQQQSLYHSFVQSEIIKVAGSVYRITEFPNFSHVVLMLHFTKSKDKKAMTDYLAKRQKDLIAEFGRILKSQN